MPESNILHFEWDETKDQTNQKKHNIPFAEAVSVFHDPSYLSMFDPDHSLDEDRWISIGRNGNGMVLVISHTFRKDENGSEKIRIISARTSTKQEELQYYKGQI